MERSSGPEIAREARDSLGRGGNQRTLSTDCLSAYGHTFCSGMRFVRIGQDGRNEYARCQCSCHRART